MKHVLLGTVPLSSLNPTALLTLKMAAVPLTPAQTAFFDKCINETVCHDGNGPITLALPDGNGGPAADKLTDGEYIFAAAHFPQIGTIIRSDANGDLQTYLSNIRTMISQGANIIVTDASFFGSSMLQVTKEAAAHKIIFITASAPVTGMQIPQDGPTSYVGGNPCGSAKQLAATVIAKQGRNHQYAMYTGLPGNSYAATWQPCLESALSSGGWTLAINGTTNWTPQGEQQAADALVASGKNVSALFYDYDTTQFATKLLQEGKSSVGIYPITDTTADFLAEYDSAAKAGKSFPCLGGPGTGWAHSTSIVASMQVHYGEKISSPIILPRPAFSCQSIIDSGEWTPDYPTAATVGGQTMPVNLIRTTLASTANE